MHDDSSVVSGHDDRAQFQHFSTQAKSASPLKSLKALWWSFLTIFLFLGM